MTTHRRKSASKQNYDCSVINSTVEVNIETAQLSRFNDFRKSANIPNIKDCEGIKKCGVEVEHGNGSSSFNWEICPLLKQLKS